MTELRRTACPAAGQRLDMFFGELVCADKPGTSLAWLGSSPASPTLQGMLRGELDISHETLDEHDSGQATAYLRARLVDLNILPQRNEPLARFDRWCEQQPLIHIAVPDRRHLTTYARWRVRPDLARRAATGTAVPNTYKHARQQVRTAIRLVQALQSRGRGLESLDQEFVDEWLAAAPSRAITTRPFLNWARDQGLTNSLDVHRSGARSSAVAIDQQRRLSHVRRLLDDDALSTCTRVAGLLVLLYGQQVTRIVSLRTSDVQRREGQMFLALGAEPVELPNGLADLVARLHDEASGSWLFGGAASGQHLHAASMRRRLRATLAISMGASRAGALLGLAAEVPAPVLAQLLGYCNDTASHWRREASGDWARYAGMASSSTADESAGGAIARQP